MNKTKTWFIIIALILFLSLIGNIYFLVNKWVESTYTPNEMDREILAEMTMKVLEHEAYEKISQNETVYSIKHAVSRFNVADPTSIFHYEIHVQTEQQTYIFTCTDEACTDVENGGWTYSRYSEEEPHLPSKN